jgi:tetratricopeptide (TPR) repeat protein
MIVFRIFRLSMKFAAWITPHVNEWHRSRNLNWLEGQRHLQAKNWPEAERHLTAALGEKHSTKHRIQVSVQLARALLSQDKLEEAALTAQAASAEAAKSRDGDVQWDALDVIADIQRAQGQEEAAIQTIDHMEQQEMKRKRPDYAKLALAMRKRGKLLVKAGRTEEASKALGDSLKFTQMKWGAEHTETANALAEVGSLHRQTGNHGEAQECLQQALNVYRAKEEFDSPEATEGLHNLAASLEESGNFYGAVENYERLLSLTERQVGGDRESVAQVQVHLAELYLKIRKTSGARELLVQAIHTLASLGGKGLTEAFELMALAEDQSSRPEEAIRWRQMAEKNKPGRSGAPTSTL